jgi:hypothetical protein
MTIMEFPVFIEISGRKRMLAYFFGRSGRWGKVQDDLILSFLK